jgi:Transposase DDE domain group 1
LNDETIPQTVLFPDLFDRPLVATFDQPHASSDGGAVLLKAAERRYRLVDAFTRCVVDDRQPGKVRHSLADLVAQRIFGLACGYPDANDADRLGDDPMQKLLLGRDPISGERLASQPTISRFENGVVSQVLYRMGRELATSVIDRHRRRLHGRARCITIDLDPTDDPTHGAQQLTFFNGHYDSWCYLPLLAFVTFDGETEQYLSAALLRPGNAPATRGARGVLCRLLALLRHAFPTARFLVRLDGGFATPEILDFLDAEPRLDYVVAMAENAVLTRFADPAMVEARALREASGHTEHVYTEAHYAAKTWPHQRRVIIKAEVVCLSGREPRDNARFVITNLRQTPRWIYEQVYCARGDIENRIKELHDGLQIGRTSCCRFWANQLRVLLTAAAYVLMQELRLRAARTACARTQVTGLRDRLLKLGVHVVVSVRRIVLHLPTSSPDLTAWRHIALALGARTG